MDLAKHLRNRGVKRCTFVYGASPLPDDVDDDRGGSSRCLLGRHEDGDHRFETVFHLRYREGLDIVLGPEDPLLTRWGDKADNPHFLTDDIFTDIDETALLRSIVRKALGDATLAGGENGTRIERIAGQESIDLFPNGSPVEVTRDEFAAVLRAFDEET